MTVCCSFALFLTQIVLFIATIACASGTTNLAAAIHQHRYNVHYEPSGDIRNYGALPNDDLDDTFSIQQALLNCSNTEGRVVIPAVGIFFISMPTQPLTPSIALAIPSNCILEGATTASDTAAPILKFSSKVNQQNWWRMLGPLFNRNNSSSSTSSTPVRNITIQGFTIDGSTNWTEYNQCRGDAGYCEHNAGIFFYTGNGATAAPIQDIVIRQMFIHSIAGDCIDVANGVQNALVEDIVIRDFLRQGVDFGGNQWSQNFIARRISEAVPWKTVVGPGGSTVHVEDGSDGGPRTITIENCSCPHGIAASSVTSLLTVRQNIVWGSLIVNGDADVVVANNTVLCNNRSVFQGALLSALSMQNGLIDGNILDATTATGNCSKFGVRLLGRKDSSSFGFTTNVSITNNVFRGLFQVEFRGELRQHVAIGLEGVDGVNMSESNEFVGPGSIPHNLTANVCICCLYRAMEYCQNITFT